MRMFFGSMFFFLVGACTFPLIVAALAQNATFQPAGPTSVNQAWNAVAVTPSDSTTLTPTRAIYNGGSSACSIYITPNGGTTSVLFANVQPGEILPVQAKVIGTSTTCTGVVALY